MFLQGVEWLGIGHLPIIFIRWDVIIPTLSLIRLGYYSKSHSRMYEFYLWMNDEINLPMQTEKKQMQSVYLQVREWMMTVSLI